MRGASYQLSGSEEKFDTDKETPHGGGRNLSPSRKLSETHQFVSDILQHNEIRCCLLLQPLPTAKLL